MYRSATWRAVLTLLFVQAACAAEQLAPVAPAGVEDGRGRFREIFCAVLATGSMQGTPEKACDHALERYADEPRGSGRPAALAAMQGGRTVLFVPGLFSDCLAGDSRFAQTMLDRGKALGYRVRIIPVSGISSSARNAAQIRDALGQLPVTQPSRRAIIVGHSKGVVDTLEALVTYPEARAKVAAVISLAGAIGGSPLAELGSKGVAGRGVRAAGARLSPG
ncbi:MAG: hypothetical protein HC814_05065 [Rhodobacteraceae bacterium]|nr:hypothetical protein [Paracoccaceae bacterium]